MFPVRHPPALCYAVPGLKYVGKVCVEIYNVNLGRKSMCVRLVGVINLRVITYNLSFGHLNRGIAAFNILAPL